MRRVLLLLLALVCVGAAAGAVLFEDGAGPGVALSATRAVVDARSAAQPKIGRFAIRVRFQRSGELRLRCAPLSAGAFSGLAFFGAANNLSAVRVGLASRRTGARSLRVPLSLVASRPAVLLGTAANGLPRLRRCFASFGRAGVFAASWRDAVFDTVVFSSDAAATVVLDSISLPSRPSAPPPTTSTARTTTRRITTNAPPINTVVPPTTAPPAVPPALTRTPSTLSTTLRASTTPPPQPPPPPPPSGCQTAAPISNTAVALPTPSLAACELLRVDSGLVDGIPCDRYTWSDASGLARSVSLARFANGRGGFAAQMTYFDTTKTPPELVVASMSAGRSDAGFGYPVGHEYYRTFDVGASDTIASLHGEDDSPLGAYVLNNATGAQVAVNTAAGTASHAFSLLYPRWGTLTPLPYPWSITPRDTSKHRRYHIPVTTTWSFASGRDEPRIKIRWDYSSAPRGTTTADTRAPYGVLEFDGRRGESITLVEWADQYRFRSSASPVKPSSPWTWNAATPAPAKRYNLLATGSGYEMGLVQTVPKTSSLLGSSYSDQRGQSSLTSSCPGDGWILPCAWSWAYQSINWELPAAGTQGKKLAWGSGYVLGSLLQWDDLGDPASGWPVAEYEVDVVLARTGGAKTRQLAGFP
ncbi:hypothetical protein DFJ74DRAFT_672064 [Hyaloraphidium curvatum]|nr:hypothetical protein DFJ74DRAFT_672064 [Hyaloraphidium curvatum]